MDTLPSPAPAHSTGPGRWVAWLGVVSVAVSVVAIGAIGMALATSSTDSRPEPTMAITGERSAMGVPVLETPGAAAGAATAGTVEVAAANWDLGTVPLDVAVRPSWTLRNTGTEPVLVGEPHAQVNEGCCPGELGMDTTTIAPGSQATLTFELAMHPGMDGWHDMDVHVPLLTGGGSETLTLSVAGDFRNA